MKLDRSLAILVVGALECASALPQVLPQGWPIILQVAKGNGAGKFGGREIHARAGRFWLTKDTKAFCSNNNEVNCPEVVRTVFAPVQKNGELHLASYLPNINPADGQQVYLDSEADLHFDNTGEIPAGAITKFTVTDGSLRAINGSTQLNPFFCPFDNAGNYGVSFYEGATERNCFPMTLTAKYAYGAYEYR